MATVSILDVSIQKTPLARVLFPYTLGICCNMEKIDPTLSIRYGIPLIVLVFILLIYSFILRKRRGWKYTYVASFYFLFFLLGMMQVAAGRPGELSTHFSHFEASQLEGIIVDEPVYREKSIRFPMRIVKSSTKKYAIPAEGKIIVSVLRDSSHNFTFRYGDRLAIRNTTMRIPPPYNPKEFDYKSYLQYKSIWHQSFLKYDDYVLINRGQASPILDPILRSRIYLVNKFKKFIENEEAYHIAVALILGYRSEVAAETLSAFTNTGTIHILSVSGLHVALVFAFLTFLLGRLDNFRFGRSLRYGIVILLVWIYVVFTGMAPPILRAGIMITFYVVSVWTGRRQNVLNTLFASAFFILLFEPNYLFDIGFQLSYLAILGILLCCPFFKRMYLPNNKVVRWIVESSYVSIAAQIFTAPVAFFYFGQFPNYFLIANLFIAIPSTIIMYVGLILAACPMDFLSVYLGAGINAILVFSLTGLKLIESFPFSVIQGIHWNVFQVILAYMTLFLFVYAWNVKNKYVLNGGLIFFFSLCLYCQFQNFHTINYKGIKVYNLRSGLGIAFLQQGNATLYSTCDSLRHPTLLYSVLPDLRRYVSEEHIEFIRIRQQLRSNYCITHGNKRILILEKKFEFAEQIDFDLIIWRKNNYTDYTALTNRLTYKALLFDGSNSDSAINNLKEQSVQNMSQNYFLKDNFAYVWQEE